MIKFIVGFIVTTIHVAESECPPYFQEFNAACYLYGLSAVVSADNAGDQCRWFGGYLLNVDSPLEYNFTVQQIQQKSYVFDGYWIGGYFDGWEWQWRRTLNNGTSVNRHMFPARDDYVWGPWQPTEGLLAVEHNIAIMIRGVSVPYAMYSENKYLQSQPNGMSFVCEANWIDG